MAAQRSRPHSVFYFPHGYPLCSLSDRGILIARRCALAVLPPLRPLLDAIWPMLLSEAAGTLADFDATFSMLPVDRFVSVGALTSPSTALASPMTSTGFLVFLCWSRRRPSGALELELRTGGGATKGGERETHQRAGALRLTPICEVEKARRPSPRS